MTEKTNKHIPLNVVLVASIFAAVVSLLTVLSSSYFILGSDEGFTAEPADKDAIELNPLRSAILLEERIQELVTKDKSQRTNSETDKLTSLLRRFTWLDEHCRQFLPRLMLDDRLSEDDRYIVWSHYFKDFYPKGMGGRLYLPKMPDDISIASRASLLVTECEPKGMKDLVKHYRTDYSSGNITDVIVHNTLLALDRKGMLEAFLKEGKKHTLYVEDTLEYDNKVRQILRYFSK